MLAALITAISDLPAYDCAWWLAVVWLLRLVWLATGYAHPCPNCGCTAASCYSYLDDFNRADTIIGTGIGPDWDTTVLINGWYIDTNRVTYLAASGPSIALLTATYTLPAQPVNDIIEFDITVGGSSAEAGAILDWTDNSNFTVISLEIGTPSYIRLHKYVAGSDVFNYSWEVTASADTTYTITIVTALDDAPTSSPSIGADMLVILMDGLIVATADVSPSPKVGQLGLWFNTGDSVFFDNFKHYVSTPLADDDCPFWTGCEACCENSEIQVTIEPTTGEAWSTGDATRDAYLNTPLVHNVNVTHPTDSDETFGGPCDHTVIPPAGTIEGIEIQRLLHSGDLVSGGPSDRCGILIAYTFTSAPSATGSSYILRDPGGCEGTFEVPLYPVGVTGSPASITVTMTRVP